MIKTFKLSSIGSKIAMALAVVSVFGVTGLTTGTVSAQSNNNRNFPTSRQDCDNWRRYGDRFDSRRDCIDWVNDRNANNNGYNGGGNGGNGGGIGQIIRQVFSFISSLLAALFAFLGRLF